MACIVVPDGAALFGWVIPLEGGTPLPVGVIPPLVAGTPLILSGTTAVSPPLAFSFLGATKRDPVKSQKFSNPKNSGFILEKWYT